jgi:aldehyde:ferredoxin oxidoreductase
MSYTGKWLKVDLSSKIYEVKKTDRNLLKRYIGGKGLGFAILNEIAPNPDPLGEKNPLIFVNGPFTGTKIQTSARTTLVTKSPLTNSALDSHCGGHFGPRIKAAGFDYIVIIGKAAKLTYLHITDKHVSLVDADDLAGKGIFESNDELIKRHPGIDPRVACIGPAGENLSKLACIGVDKHRQYGRGGTGAVMGSKNLKAIVVDGKQPIQYHDEKAFKKLNLALAKDILKNPGVKIRREKGTMICIRKSQKYKFLPTKNFQKCQFNDFEKLSSETARKELNWKDTSCFGCSIRCSKWARFEGHEVEGPEYETAAFLGSGCEISSIKEVTIANELCNDLGMDTISAGVTCSFAMECYEKKLLNDWSGLKLDWGNVDAQKKFLQLMASREGVGAIFADGTRDAACRIGPQSEEFAININGMELSGVNPKGSLTMGVMLSVADFASHTRFWCTEGEMGESFKIEDIPKTIAQGIDTINVRNSLVICDFVPEGLKTLAEVLNAITGFEHTESSLMNLGANISDLARCYNLRNGRSFRDDILPERFFNEKSLSGFKEGRYLEKQEFTEIVQQYYKIRGWNSEGEPQMITQQSKPNQMLKHKSDNRKLRNVQSMANIERDQNEATNLQSTGLN